MIPGEFAIFWNHNRFTLESQLCSKPHEIISIDPGHVVDLGLRWLNCAPSDILATFATEVEANDALERARVMWEGLTVNVEAAIKLRREQTVAACRTV